MFLKEQTLLKLMKRGFKKWGLTVGRHDDKLYLRSEGWEVETDFSTVSKNIKAEIVKYCGTLPEREECATLSPGGSQESMPLPEIGEPSLEGMHKEFRTNLRMGKAYLMQAEERLEHAIILISEEYVEMVEAGMPNYERGECDVSGPYLGDDGMIYYWTNTTTARFFPMDEQKQHHLLKKLNEINLMELDP